MHFIEVCLSVGVVSFVLVWWLLRAGHVEETDGPWSLGKRIDGFGKKRKKERKAQKKTAKEEKAAGNADKVVVSSHRKMNLLHEKWLTFGGGFYGVVALVTYLRIEVIEVYEWLTQFGSFISLLTEFRLELLVKLFINSILNFVAAIAWPVYWLDRVGHERPWLWLISAYAAYWIGVRLAWYGRNMSIGRWGL